MRLTRALVLATLIFRTVAPAAVHATDPPQDPELLRFVGRAITYCPNSNLRLTSSERRQTASGSYRLMEVDRSCSIDLLSGPRTVVVDDVAELAWFGSAAKMPLDETGIGGDALKNFVNEFLPEALKNAMRMNVSVDWNFPPHRNGALLSFWLVVQSGYGEYRKEAAVTADGAYFVLGPVYPLDSDPVAVRRQVMDESGIVIWDLVEAEDAAVEIVEFSDFECPACSRRWPMVKRVFEANGSKVNHGMVSFPLTVIHPWSFRAASASWCVADQNPEMLIPFKELFYELQPEMGVSLVTPTARDFVAGNGLDEAMFNQCYLKQQSLDAVHDQLALGQRLGIISTPTYVVNGWMLQAVSEDWFTELIERIAAGEEPL
jgi:protein-disulfide isomerase